MPHSLLTLAAVTAIVTGVVHDRTTGQPMPGVTIAIGSHHAVTNASGRYTIGGVHPGKQTMTVSSGDVPAQTFPFAITRARMHFDVKVCSMTLDYHCNPGAGAGISS